jgi:hypothetical protein
MPTDHSQSRVPIGMFRTNASIDPHDHTTNPAASQREAFNSSRPIDARRSNRPAANIAAATTCVRPTCHHDTT